MCIVGKIILTVHGIDQTMVGDHQILEIDTGFIALAIVIVAATVTATARIEHELTQTHTMIGCAINTTPTRRTTSRCETIIIRWKNSSLLRSRSIVRISIIISRPPISIVILNNRRHGIRKPNSFLVIVIVRISITMADGSRIRVPAVIMPVPRDGTPYRRCCGIVVVVVVAAVVGRPC